MVLISRWYPVWDGHSCQVQGPRSLILDTWYLILDTWYLIHDPWSMIIDTWSLIFDRWSLIHDPWSMILDPWSMIHDPWWEAFAPRMSLRSGSGPEFIFFFILSFSFISLTNAPIPGLIHNQFKRLNRISMLEGTLIKVNKKIITENRFL